VWHPFGVCVLLSVSQPKLRCATPGLVVGRLRRGDAGCLNRFTVPNAGSGERSNSNFDAKGEDCRHVDDLACGPATCASVSLLFFGSAEARRSASPARCRAPRLRATCATNRTASNLVCVNASKTLRRMHPACRKPAPFGGVSVCRAVSGGGPAAASETLARMSEPTLLERIGPHEWAGCERPLGSNWGGKTQGSIGNRQSWALDGGRRTSGAWRLCDRSGARSSKSTVAEAARRKNWFGVWP